jgi:hypothetical protein
MDLDLVSYGPHLNKVIHKVFSIEVVMYVSHKEALA